MSATTATKALGLLLVLAGWAAVLRGLFLLPVSTDPELDLEAGPAFAVNVSVYLPAMALTVLLLVALPVALAARAAVGAAVGAAAAIAATVFPLWVLTQPELLSYIPGLGTSLWIGAGLAVVGLLVFSSAVAVQWPAAPAGAVLREDDLDPR